MLYDIIWYYVIFGKQLRICLKPSLWQLFMLNEINYIAMGKPQQTKWETSNREFAGSAKCLKN